MSPRIVTSLMMAAFPLCGGIWATLVGFEYIGKPAGAELNPKYAIRRRVYRLGGPVVIVLGLWVALQPIVAPLQGIVWEVYAPQGAGFSIEMPGRPEISVIDETGDFGPVKTHVANVQNRHLRTTNTVVYYEFPKGFQPGADGRRKEHLKDLVAQLAEKWEGEVVADEDLASPSGFGRGFRIKLKDDFIYRGQIWFLGHGQFQLMAVGPSDMIDSDISRRFFDSFSYNAPDAVPTEPNHDAADESTHSK